MGNITDIGWVTKFGELWVRVGPSTYHGYNTDRDEHPTWVWTYDEFMHLYGPDGWYTRTQSDKPPAHLLDPLWEI